MIGGTLFYLTKNVAHSQYIATNDLAKEINAIDFLFEHLIKVEFSKYDYFDFGHVNENNGLFVNKGLLQWKEGFGARSLCHDFYTISTKNKVYLNNLV